MPPARGGFIVWYLHPAMASGPGGEELKNMRTNPRLLVLLLIGLLVPAGAVLASDAKGVVTVAYDGVPRDIFPVAILEVDGVLQPTPLRETLFLTPGKHTLRVAVRVTDGHLRLRGNNGKVGEQTARGLLEIEVEAGKRYHIGGKIDGYRTSDWEPVVLRVEDVRG